MPNNFIHSLNHASEEKVDLHNLPSKIGNHKFRPLHENKITLEYQPPIWFGLLVFVYLLAMIFLQNAPESNLLDILQSVLSCGLLISMLYVITITPSLILTPTEFTFHNADRFTPYSKVSNIRIRNFPFKFDVIAYTEGRNYTLASFTNRKDAEQLAQIFLELRDNS